MDIVVPLDVGGLRVSPIACQCALIDHWEPGVVYADSCAYTVPDECIKLLQSHSPDGAHAPDGAHILHVDFVPIYLHVHRRLPPALAPQSPDVPFRSVLEFVVRVRFPWHRVVTSDQALHPALTQYRSRLLAADALPSSQGKLRLRFAVASAESALQTVASNSPDAKCQLCMSQNNELLAECGHALCVECYYRLQRAHSGALSCPTCRRESLPRDMLAVHPVAPPDGSAACAVVAIVQQYGAVRLITWSRAARDETARQLDSISPGASRHVTYIVDLGSVAHLQAHGGGPVVVDCTSGTAADHPGPWVSLARAVAWATVPAPAPVVVLVRA